VSDLVEGLREAASGKGGLDYGDFLGYCDEAADEIECLRAELAEARRDAERYRWLREQCGPDGNLTIAEAGGWSLRPWGGDDPDAAVDAARGES
jgi:hypothetical protein